MESYWKTYRKSGTHELKNKPTKFNIIYIMRTGINQGRVEINVQLPAAYSALHTRLMQAAGTPDSPLRQ